MSAHLWEVEHAYYCSESNYYSNEPGASYKTWADFMSEWGASDLDYNLVFRWDWKEGADEGAGEFTGDVNYRNGTLYLFFILQRKGIFSCQQIEVCRADEPAVLAFLAPRFAYLTELWSPLKASASAEGG